MGIIQAFTGAISGTFADQWKDVITASTFDEHVVIIAAGGYEYQNGQESVFIWR